MKTVRLGASACVAALALALTCGVASAQLQKAPETKKAEPAAKAAEPAKKTTAPAKPKCNELKAETACAGDTTCQWVAASKTAAGKDIKAYCRTTPKPKATEAKKVEPAKGAAPAADKAPAAKAVTPPAKTPPPPAAPKN